jgi:hypothetical protein
MSSKTPRAVLIQSESSVIAKSNSREGKGKGTIRRYDSSKDKRGMFSIV